MIPLRRGVQTVVFLALVLALGSGSLGRALAQDQPAPADGALVRVVHGVPDIGPIDLYIDGSLAVIGSGFPSVTDPLTVSAGEHRIVVTLSGGSPDAALVDSVIEIAAGTTDEIAVLGSANMFEARLFQADRSLLAPGKARLRFIHASPDAGSIDPVVSGGVAIFPALEFLTASEYADVDAGPYPMTVNVSAGGGVLLDLPDLVLEPNSVNDVYVVGQVVDSTMQGLVVQSEAEAPPPVQGVTAAVREGTCPDPGELLAPVGIVAEATGDEAGAGDGVAVERGFATIPNEFLDLIAGDRVIAVSPSADDATSTIACGAIAGRLTDDGSLVMGLRATGDDTAVGVAVLAPGVLDPQSTDISVFLLPNALPEPDDEEDSAPAASTPVVTGG